MRTAVRHKHSYTVPEVLRMQAEGQPNSQIGQHFGISRARVGQIIKEEKGRVASAAKAERLRQQIRASVDLTDLDRKLLVDDLFCLLQLPPIVCRRFKQSCQWRDIRELSLREFMDVLLPLVDNPKNFYEVLPAFKIRLVGKKSYAAMTARLSSLDLGEVFKTEWDERVRRLKEYLIASEGYQKGKSLLYRFGMTNDGC